jgi:hypothetical protein
MSMQLEGIITFPNHECFQSAVDLLNKNKLVQGQALLIDGKVAHPFALNDRLQALILPPMTHPKLLEIIPDILEYCCSNRTYFKAISPQDNDFSIWYWDDKQPGLKQFSGLEIAELAQQDQRFLFELDYEQMERTSISEEEFLQQRKEVALQIYQTIEGIMEVEAVSQYLSQLS